MKFSKIIALMLVLAMIFSFAACGEKEEPDDPNTLTIGPYTAEYKGCEIAKDSEGNDAIVINFTFHNGGEDEESFEWAYFYTVMQGGLEMEYAVVWVSEDSYDTLDESTRLNVAPGGSHDVSLTYALRDKTTPIEFKVSDLMDEEHDSITIDPASAKPRAESIPAQPEEGADEPADNPTEEPDTTVSADTDAGYWILASIESDNPDTAVDEETMEMLRDLGFKSFVELREDGTGTFMTEEPWEITWGDGLFTLEGESISYTRSGDELSCVIEGDVYNYIRGEGSAPEVGAAESALDYEDFWCGDWYGWWAVVDGSTGYYADLVGDSWDCCAYIEPYDGDYLMTVWDTDFNDYANDALGQVFLEFSGSFFSDTSAANSIDHEHNFFWAGNVGYYDWYMDPGILETDDTIVFGSEYTDSDGDTLVYSIVLTKWPNEWDTDLLTAPEHYDSFFVPLMEAGEDLPIVFEP